MDVKNLKYTLYEREGSIARIIFNNPDKLNAINLIGDSEESQEFYFCLEETARDDDVKVVIISGKGRAFNVGHDLTKVGFVYGFGTGKDDKRPSQRIRLDMDRKANERVQGLFLHPKITICQCHGYCYGVGVFFPIVTDLAIASEDAQFGCPEQRLGFSGSGVPGISHLILTIGLKRTLDLILTGRTISGKEAARIGLVNKAVPIEDLHDEVDKMAKAISLLPRDGIAIGKATRHLIYNRLGLTDDFTPGYISHTLFTNLRWEADEYNFFKERRDKGAKAGFHGRDERFKGLV
ncbi:enoyl-CoA hydratase/isomerase family protein [Chloroflexota bacterium]